MLRCVYVDLDGTLLGPGGSILRDADGGFSTRAIRALEAAHRAAVEVVIYSGRRRAQVHEDARVLGMRAYIFELGSALVIDGEIEWLTGEWIPGERSIHDQIADTGAPQLLMDNFRLEHHEPFHKDREVTHLFRGLVDTDEVAAFLREHGIDNLRLVDNGTIRSRDPDLPITRAYHLVPDGTSKPRAVARHMQARGYAPDECIAVGDSREDMSAADVVGAFWLVANAIERDPTLRNDVRPNVRIADGRYGEGVYEAVVTTLAER
jgi:HAD superfamily hydrolase (TIGR01484 family)